MITELVPAEFRTQAIGVYWSIRSVGVMLAPLVGGLVWYWIGPEAMLWCAGILGVLGAAFFYWKFAAQSGATAINSSSATTTPRR